MISKFIVNLWEWLLNHWDWLSSITLSAIGVRISFLSYRHAKEAEKGTISISKDVAEEAINRISNLNKEENRVKMREELIKAAIAEWKTKGQCRSYLATKYIYLKDKGWTKEEFESIYNEVGKLSKGRPFKQPLFE